MLTGPLLLPPLLLAGLLVLSGGAKARHTDATRSAFRELRVPATLADSAAPRALPWVEIVLAAALLLLPRPVAVPVAVLALLLFVTYLAVIARALTFDHPVTCGCFGELGLGEVTRRTLVRNVLLVLLAGLTVWSTAGEPSVAARLLGASAGTWAWLGLVVLGGAVLVTTFGGTKGAPPLPEGGTDYERQPLPFATLADEEGGTLTMHELTTDGAVLLLFLSPGCGSCRPIIERLPQWSAGLGPVRVRAVVAQSLETAIAAAPELAGRVLRDEKGVTARIFRVGTPGAVLLGGDGLLAGGPVQGAEVLDFYEDVRAELVDGGAVAPDDAGAGEPVTGAR